MIKKIKEQIHNATKKVTSSKVESTTSITNNFYDNREIKVIDSVLIKSEVGSSNESIHHETMKGVCNPDCPCWGQPIAHQRRCPLCGFEFKSGWLGLDAHYNKYHFKDTGVPYQEWKSLMCSEHRPGK